MSKSGRKRVFKFKRLKDKENGSQEYDSIPVKARGFDNIKSMISSFDEPNRPKQPSEVNQKVSIDRFRKVAMVGEIPQNSRLNLFFGKFLKSRNVSVHRLPKRSATLLGKEVSSLGFVSESLMQKEHAAPQFLSILIGKGRLIRHKAAVQLLGRRVWGEAEDAKRLPYAKRLELFQALLIEPLPFLDLHARFSVSKQTLMRLVKKGLLVEVWGPKAIGVRFKLSKKGKVYLKELEAAAKYESKLSKKDLIRLKHKTPL